MYSIKLLHNATRVGRNPMLRVDSLHAYMLTRLHVYMFTRLHATLRNRSYSAKTRNRSHFAMLRANKLHADMPMCLHIYVFTCCFLI